MDAKGENGKQAVEMKPKTHMQEIDDALKACKFGKFHMRVLCSGFFGLICSVLTTNATPYILPNAECDLHMNMLQKGILNAAPFVGMVVISVVAGFLTDTFGRKIFLIGGFGGMFLFAFIASISQTFEMLVVAKFIEGISFAAAFTPCVPFTSEFCHSGIRDRVMLVQYSFISLGQLLLAAFSLGVLTQDWRFSFFDGYIVLNTWNCYLLILSLWPLTACILYCFLPESPKYLITQHRYDEARNTLIKIYQQNTGNPADTFPYKDIWKNVKSQTIDEAAEDKLENKNSTPNSLRRMLVVGLHNLKPVFRKPLGPYLILFCAMNFLIMCMYNVIKLWFPQLSTIVEHYSESESDLCGMLDTYSEDLRAKTVNTTGSEICVPVKSGTETYINSIIQGTVCFLPYLITGVIVNKVGKKNLQMTAGLISIACTICPIPMLQILYQNKDKSVVYNVIRLWFPQLSTIVEHYSESESDLCAMLDTYSEDLRAKTVNTTGSEICVPIKSGTETYINSTIQGTVCFLPYLITGVIVNKVGKKNLQITAGLISVACTLSIRWASTKTQVIALLVTDIALGQALMNILQVITIEVFPTVTRALAVSITMTFGRLGTLVGNIVFPILLDMGCSVPFFTLTGVMIGLTLLTFLLPNKKKP